MNFVKFALFVLASWTLLVGCNPNQNAPGRYDRNQPAQATSPTPGPSVPVQTTEQ